MPNDQMREKEAMRSLKITSLTLGVMFLMFGLIHIYVTPPQGYIPNPTRLASNINQINLLAPSDWTGYRFWPSVAPLSGPNDAIGIILFDNSPTHRIGHVKATG